MPPKAHNSKSRTSPDAGPPKMRSSCEACANSKIGCSKERPTCSQCERRDISCVYVATKRAGRPAKNKDREQTTTATQVNNSEEKPEPSLPPITSPIVAPSLSASWSNDLPDATIIDTTMTNTTIADTASIFTPPPSLSQHNLDWCMPAYAELFKNLPTSTANPDDLVSSLPPLSKPFSHMLGATSPLSLLDDNLSMNGDSFLLQPFNDNEFKGFHNYEEIWGNSLGDGYRNMKTPMPSDHRRSGATPESIDWFSATDTLNAIDHAPRMDTPTKQHYPFPSSMLGHDQLLSHGCLARCLSLLNQLTPQWNAASCTQDMEKNSASNSVSFESIMAQNQAASDAIDDMLNCPCSHNSVLLFTIFLVLCNMLGWYAACADAARTATNGEDTDSAKPISSLNSLGRTPPVVRRPLQSTLRDYEMDVTYENRIVCQIVLSRLYSVRRILSALTRRMTELEAKPSTPNSSAERVSAATVNLLLDGPAFDASSPASLGQTLAHNLRCHLHELCENIRRTLSAL